jgi:hypothetical protein
MPQQVFIMFIAVNAYLKTKCHVCKKSKQANQAAADPSEEKLQTEGPISERDEVKEAEERTRKLQKDTKQPDKDKK